ncbi:hypothetical protein J6TS7_26560 [Paenibacillus dendritiformis]|nr:hypothetical protein [Paenibacillus melissococcoides]GIO79046.1 hypothetical protein J6TS7_26560 [Paenibacillus dendritiformis]
MQLCRNFSRISLLKGKKLHPCRNRAARLRPGYIKTRMDAVHAGSQRLRFNFEQIRADGGQGLSTLAKKPARYIDACSSVPPVREWRTSSA